jgi:hypothetical protein
LIKALYHNLTKNWFNESDYGDAAENSEARDKIKISFQGNALLFDLLKEDPNIEFNGENNWAREQFLNAFKEFHGVDFTYTGKFEDEGTVSRSYNSLSIDTSQYVIIALQNPSI